MSTEPRPSLTDEPNQEVIAWSIFGGLLLVLIWGYWNSLMHMASFWSQAQYSHGYLIPLFAAVLMWLRRERIGDVALSARWAGVALLTGSLLMRWVSSYYSIVTFDDFSFIPALAGILLIVGGWRMIVWAGPAVGFLVFMVPWPMVMTRGILQPLQKLASVFSTFALQTLGLDVYREDTVIMLVDQPLNVIGACSGLRMATIFVALTVAVVLITSRPWWERVVILASAIPIAVVVNVIRIIITGLCWRFQPENSEMAEVIFHDIAGFIMMPIALGLLYLECVILSNLFITVEPEQHVRFGGRGAPRPV
jgi:exosortase